MSPNIYVLTLCLLFGTVLLIFTMRYGALALQARAKQAHEDAHRQALAEIRDRLSAIETLLKSVD